jgi:hypothetical protein
VVIGDDQLHAPQASVGQRAQERGPEGGTSRFVR